MWLPDGGFGRAGRHAPRVIAAHDSHDDADDDVDVDADDDADDDDADDDGADVGDANADDADVDRLVAIINHLLHHASPISAPHIIETQK